MVKSGVRQQVAKCLVNIFVNCCLLFLSCSAESAAPNTGISSTTQPLSFGFLPVESPVALFKRFAPLHDYVENHINRHIRMETAKDFKSFNERIALREYDIVFTAPHLALQALDSQSYEIAAAFIKPLRSVVVVNENSPLRDVMKLEGKLVATPPETAIVTKVGVQFLKAQGLKSIKFKTYQSHNAAYSAVVGGEADAAIVSNFMVLNAEKKNIPLRIIVKSEPFPGIGILVAKDLDDTLKDKIKKTFWEMKSTTDGKQMLKAISQPGYTEAKPSDFEILRPYLNNTIKH